MKKVRLSELSEDNRVFLEHLLEGDGVEIQDDSGLTRGQVVPWRDPTPEQEQAADASLAKLWKKTGAAMEKAGVTEDDIVRDLLEDD